MIQDYEVPVFVIDISSHLVRQWDLTLHQIIPFLNGVYYVKKIAQLSNVDLHLVKLSIRQLLYYNIIKMVDIFQFSNTYQIRSREKLHAFYENREIQQSCLSYIFSPSQAILGKSIEICSEQPVIDFIFQLFCQLSSRCSVEDLCKRNQASIQKLKINIRKVIVFGVLNDILCRLHRYPLLMNQIPSESSTSRVFLMMSDKDSHISSVSSTASSSPSFNTRLTGNLMQSDIANEKVISMLDGAHHLDQLCCEFDLSLQEMKSLLDRIVHCHYILS